MSSPLPEIPSGPAWYNEINPDAAGTLRDLIASGVIAPGDVDERSIEDVNPAELVRYTQRHFFAGYGIWSYALRAEGWPDDVPVVTGSCPCQPFSAAGAGLGIVDERHLWPSLYWHVAFGEPCPVFGEQVASDDGLDWLDHVLSDLEMEAYTAGAIDLCSAGGGAPHIRQRLHWMAYPEDERYERFWGAWGGRLGFTNDGAAIRMADAELHGRDPREQRGSVQQAEGEGRLLEPEGRGTPGTPGSLADADDRRRGSRGGGEPEGSEQQGRHGFSEQRGVAGFVDDTIREGLQGLAGDGDRSTGWQAEARPASAASLPRRLVDADGGASAGGDERLGQDHVDARVVGNAEGDDERRERIGGAGGGLPHRGSGAVGDMGDATRRGWRERGDATREGRSGHAHSAIEDERPGPTNGFWRATDWLFCRDGRMRPVEPGSSPLAYGLPASFRNLPEELQRLAEVAGLDRQSLARAKRYRVASLRGYGNAVNAELTRIYVRAGIAILAEAAASRRQHGA